MRAVLAAFLMASAVGLLVPAVAATRLTSLNARSGGSPRAGHVSSSRWWRWRAMRRSQRTPHDLRLVAESTDLLSSLLSSGVDVISSVQIVSTAVPEPASTTLTAVSAALRLGCPPADAWGSLGERSPWAPVAEAMARSARSGSPLSDVLSGVADDLRLARTRDVQVAARGAGVRAVGPLAACFLPAYLLLGVVPVVASLAGDALRG